MNLAMFETILIATSLSGFPWPEVRPTPQAPDNEAARLTGAWLCIERIVDDSALPHQAFKDPLFLVIEDSRYVEIPLVYGQPRLDVARVWDLTLDPRRNPKTLDLNWRSIGIAPHEKRGSNDKLKGIYRMNSDNLIVCMGNCRPTEFTAPAGSGRTCCTYRRVEPRGPAARPNPQAAAELERLAGTWIPIQEIDNGEVTVLDPLPWSVLEIKGNRYLIRAIDENGRPGSDSDSIELAIDPTRTPKSLDLISRPGVISRWIDEGIYRLEGDTLTVCIGSRHRPAVFAAPSGSGQSLVVYKRSRKPKADYPRP